MNPLLNTRLEYNLLVLPTKRQQGINMSNDANVTKTEKLKVAHNLQKPGMPSKVAAKLAGIPQGKVPRWV